MRNRFGYMFGRTPYGDPDKCWGCGLFRQWDGVTLLCPTCRELQHIYLRTADDAVSIGESVYYGIGDRLHREERREPPL